jgi:hypothetical protein
MKPTVLISGLTICVLLAAGSGRAEVVTVREGKVGTSRYKVTRDSVRTRHDPLYTVAVVRADGKRVKREVFDRLPSLHPAGGRVHFARSDDWETVQKQLRARGRTTVIEKVETTDTLRFGRNRQVWNDLNLVHQNPALQRGQQAETARQNERAAREAALWPQ